MIVPKRKNDCKSLKGNIEYGDDLDKFYAIFDCPDFESEREEIKID